MINSPLPQQLPHMRDNSVMQMGMQVVSEQQWLEPCVDLEPFYQHKCHIRETYGNRVFASVPESQAAQRELQQLLLQHLLSDHDQVYGPMGNDLVHLPSGLHLRVPTDNEQDPLWQTSLWVADDLLLMQPLASQGNQYCLTAASLCSPSAWHLLEKLGNSMTRIHDPIPGIHQQLTPQIDRFLANVAPGQVVERRNWSLQGASQLDMMPGSLSEPLSADEPVYYRMERQSLRRLPESGAIVFGIRIYIYEVGELAAVSEAIPALRKAIDDMPAELREYKDMAKYIVALEKYWSQ